MQHVFGLNALNSLDWVELIELDKLSPSEWIESIVIG